MGKTAPLLIGLALLLAGCGGAGERSRAAHPREAQTPTPTAALRRAPAPLSAALLRPDDMPPGWRFVDRLSRTSALLACDERVPPLYEGASAFEQAEYAWSAESGLYLTHQVGRLTEAAARETLAVRRRLGEARCPAWQERVGADLFEFRATVRELPGLGDEAVAARQEGAAGTTVIVVDQAVIRRGDLVSVVNVTQYGPRDVVSGVDPAALEAIARLADRRLQQAAR